jgi:CubicO group peptidase (beta-lactamase class C family)
MQKKLTGAGHLLLTLALAAPALAVEPSPVQATGVINEKFGADSSNWDIAPFNAFTFTQTEKIFPTLIISPGEEPFAPLRYAESQLDMSQILVTDPATGKSISAATFLNDRIRNSGLMLIYKGQVVHESYRNGLQRDLRHIGMSASKSFIGMLTQIAMQQGFLDEHDLASQYVPEVRDKEAWIDVTVRHVLDMRDGMKFVEDYEDADSDVRRQDRAIGWRARREGDPEGLRDFVRQNLNEKSHPAGKVFNYASIQTDILGMIIEGATGKPLEEFFEAEFWSRLGAEFPAGMGTDGFGQPIVQGTISMTLPDLARVAMFVLNKGQNYRGEQIINADFFDDLLTPDEELSAAFAYYDPEASFAHYRSQFWVNDTWNKQFLMNGVHGQIAFFDYERDFAMVGFGSYPVAVSPLLDASLFTLLETVLSELDH